MLPLDRPCGMDGIESELWSEAGLEAQGDIATILSALSTLVPP